MQLQLENKLPDNEIGTLPSEFMEVYTRKMIRKDPQANKKNKQKMETEPK